MKRTPLKRRACLKRSTKRIRAKINPEDTRWSSMILEYDPLCLRCDHPRPPTVHAHHIIPRRFGLTRHDLMNGIGLCAKCHDRAHSHEREFRLWFATLFPMRWEFLVRLSNILKYRLEKT